MTNNNNIAKTNHKLVENNHGRIDVNKNAGTVTENHPGVTIGALNQSGGNFGTLINRSTVIKNNESNACIVENYGTVKGSDQYATIENNQSTGIIESTSSTITNNYGTVVAQHSDGSIENNFGTVTTNGGTIKNNFGTITNNTGTVVNHFGSTTVSGTVTNHYPFQIASSAASNLSFSSAGSDPAAVRNIGENIWIKAGADVRIAAKDGYKLTSPPAVTGGTLTLNAGGSYTLSGVTGNITLTATTETTGNVGSNSGGHTHSLTWIKTLEPTETTDGLWEYKCEECGHIEAKQSVTFYEAILKNIILAIKEAPANGTVTVENTFLRCFSNEIVEALLARPDVGSRSILPIMELPIALLFRPGRLPQTGRIGMATIIWLPCMARHR